MVKRTVLEKMSNNELLKYFKPDTRFVADALELAFDILKKRKYLFTGDEERRIMQLIEAKREAEHDLHLTSTWDIGEDEQNGTVSFYSQTVIWVLGILFGTLVGSILLSINLFKISTRKGLLTISFGIVYSCILYFVYIVSESNFSETTCRMIWFILNIFGIVIIQIFFWKKYLNGIVYKKLNATVPFAVCLIVSLILYFIGIFLYDEGPTEIIYELY